jgi:HAD superfamily hydrolase (TIGR01509 family)
LIILIEALIFDCDGTLTDSMFAHFSAWRDALLPQGMLLDAQKQGLTVDFKRALALKEELFIANLSLLTPIEPVVNIARQHRGKLQMAVASGGTRTLVHLQLRQLNIMDWFQAVVTCEDTERHKPDPDVFLEAARLLGVAPQACRVYEDGEPGIEAAGRAGMECVDIRQLV